MEDEDLKFCNLCLVTDVKMYSLNTPSILEAYSQLLQLVYVNHQMYVCYECVSLLQKYQQFRLKCLTAINVLSSVQMDHSKITKDIVKTIDRNLFNLESRLSCSTLLHVEFNEQEELRKDCNKIDLTLSEDEMESNVKIEIDVPKIELKIDTDSKNYKQEDCTDFAIEMVLEPDDFEQSNSCDSEIKIKRKCFPKLEKSEDIKISTEELVQNVNKIDKPAKVKRTIRRTRRKDKNSLKKDTKKDTGRYSKKSIQYIENRFKDYGTFLYMSPEDAMKEVLSRKESRNYKLNPFKCELCFKGFNVETTYDNHMKKHSPESGNWECEFCHQRFTTKRLMNEHIMCCHKRKYTCKKCPYVCYSINQVNAHVNRHKGKTFECQECGLTFSMSNSLSSHKRHKHPTEEVCALCGNLYGSLQGLNAHQKVFHRQDSKELLGPKCEECNVQFVSETAWKRHLVLSPKHNASNGCEHCGESFTSYNALKEHRKQHPRSINKRCYDFNPPDACKICNQWLTSLNQYKTHTKSQHPNSDAAKVILKKEAEEQSQFVCEMCGDLFKTKAILQYHHRNHTGERPYQCAEPGCGKAFSQPASLAQHAATHRERRRTFQCDMCHKQYYVKNALAIHIKTTHLGIRPYKCSFCGRSYLHKYGMKNHINYVHYKKPWPKRERKRKDSQ